MKIEGLTFQPLPLRDRESAAAVKCAVLKGGAIKLTFNATAFEKLGKPSKLLAEGAVDGDGNCFLKLGEPKMSGATAWPVHVRKPPEGGRGGVNKRVSAWCVISAHTFTIGVVHPAQDCEADWKAETVVIALPNWQRMLDEIEAEAGVEGDDDE